MKYLVLLLLLACNTNLKDNPRFKVGDCTESCMTTDNTDNEFIQETNKQTCIYKKIIAVGKKNYLYSFYKGKLKGEFSIRLSDEFYRKVHNSYCEEN